MSLSPYGLLELPLWGYALVTFVTIQTMFLGVTLYLHRDQSHGGLILHPSLRHVFRFWLWFSSGAITKELIAVHLMAQPFFAGGVINGLGHAVGYRSFEMPSTATNLVPWALLLGGEELHNNHHAFPRSARFAVQRWEIDIGWLWIRLFSALGLARVRWVAPRPQFERRRRDLDADTVNALFTNRLRSEEHTSELQSRSDL